jgi:hypothetical protein
VKFSGRVQGEIRKARSRDLKAFSSKVEFGSGGSLPAYWRYC